MKEEVARRLKAIRIARGKDVHEMAEKTEMSYSAYSKIERGFTDPSVDRLAQLADILQIHITDFFSDNLTMPEASHNSRMGELEKRVDQLEATIETLQKNIWKKPVKKSTRQKKKK